jgi:hypothetical protein
MLAWFSNLLRVMKHGAVWGVPGSTQVYRIDKKNKTLILIAGDPHDELHWHDKNIKTLAALGWKVKVALENSSDTQEATVYFELVNLVRHPKSGVLFLSTGLGYAVDAEGKAMILMRGKPDAAHAQVKAFMQTHGWTVLDDPNDSANPDEMSFAEHVTAKQIRFELLEDAGTPFAKTPVTLQYRPFRLGDDWKWYWVLLPDDRSKALGSGQGDSRAEAAVGARKEARKLGVVISSIDVLKPREQV